MKKINYLILGVLLFLFMGCSKAEERINNAAVSHIDRGNFIDASYLLSEAIKLNPNYLDGVVNYRNVYPRAIDQANEKIEEYRKVSDYKLEAYAYEDLLKLKNNYYYADSIIHQKLGYSLEIPTIEELYELKSTMGTVYYSAGNELENRKLNRMEKRDRYFLYERGVELSPKYKDIVNKRETAYQEALVKTMIKISKNMPNQYKNNLDAQIKGNIVRGRNKSLVRIVPLEENAFNSAWQNNRATDKVNTGIEINLNYINYTPETTRKSVKPLTWYDEYTVQTKTGPVVKKRKRTYFRYDFLKSSDVIVSFTYTMKDLSTGEIIGSGTFDGIGEDRHNWSTFSGDLPNKEVRGSYTRQLKSERELTEIAIKNAVIKMSDDISEKI